MREDRFFVDFLINCGNYIIKDKDIVHQLKNVLRKRVGERIILCDTQKNYGLAKIKRIFNNKIEVEILEIKENKREPSLFVSLFCSVLKKSNFELVVQKTTEIGVKEIFPLICKNTVKKGLNLDRLTKIAKESAEQSGRGIIPQIFYPISFQEAILKAKNFDLKVFFDISGKNFSEIKKEKTKRIALFVGPEGGWTKEEIETAKKENFQIINLGKLNLRAETAAIVGCFLIVYSYEN